MNNDRIEGAGKKFEGTVQNSFGKVTDDASNEAKGTARKVIGEIQATYGKAQDCAKDSIKAVENQINDKPVQSALVALGIGFILGKLSRF